jgi:hypothetical protein
MKNFISTLAVICYFLLAEVNFAQTLFDARRLSMAGSNIAITEGSEYFGANPATLAYPRHFNFELHLASAHAMINNNSYSLNEYDKYFTTGDSLSSSDINDLLSNIPESGLKGRSIRINIRCYRQRVHKFSKRCVRISSVGEYHHTGIQNRRFRG